MARKQRVVHISSHSFTPELDGHVRTADIGLLYDPARRTESELCQRWQQTLQALRPSTAIRRNYPYRGKGDGLTSYLRKHFAPEMYVGIELEINQKLVFGPDKIWQELRTHLIDSLQAALPLHHPSLSESSLP